MEDVVNMIIFILLIVLAIIIVASSSKERKVMSDVNHIARDNEKVMWKEIEKNNERWKK